MRFAASSWRRVNGGHRAVLLLLDRHQHQRSSEQRHGVGVLRIDGFEAHLERELQLDAVAGLPFAVDRGEMAGNGEALLPRAVHRNGSSFGPCGNAEVQGQLGGRVRLSP